MMKFHDYGVGQVSADDELDAREICVKRNSLVQQRKYTEAKQEVGKTWSIPLEAVDDLQDMGIIKPDMVEQKNQRKGWDRYNVIKIKRTEPEQ